MATESGVLRLVRPVGGQCAEGFVAAGSSSEPRCLDVKQAARVWNVAGARLGISLTLPVLCIINRTFT